MWACLSSGKGCRRRSPCVPQNDGGSSVRLKREGKWHRNFSCTLPWSDYVGLYSWTISDQHCCASNFCDLTGCFHHETYVYQLSVFIRAVYASNLFQFAILNFPSLFFRMDFVPLFTVVGLLYPSTNRTCSLLELLEFSCFHTSKVLWRYRPYRVILIFPRHTTSSCPSRPWIYLLTWPTSILSCLRLSSREFFLIFWKQVGTMLASWLSRWRTTKSLL